MTSDCGPALVGQLESLVRREDRGALAALRRGLGKPPGEAPEMFPYVESACDRAESPSGAPREAYVVASLFALHQRHHREPTGRHGGLGRSIRSLRRVDGEEDQGVVRRFAALLDAGGEALPEHLRHLVALLKSRRPEATIDYLQLFYDLRDWDRPDHRVQKRWAAEFWGHDAGDGDNAEDTTGIAPDNTSEDHDD